MQAGPHCDPTSTSASTFTVKHLAPEMEGNALSSTKQHHISNEVCQVHLLWPGRRKDACTSLRVWLQTHNDFPAAELRCRHTHTSTFTPHPMCRTLSTDGHRLNKGLRGNASSNPCNSPKSLHLTDEVTEPCKDTCVQTQQEGGLRQDPGNQAPLHQALQSRHLAGETAVC